MAARASADMGAADTEAALLAELQAEYAGMEAARKTYSEESQAVIKEQKLLMEALTTENAALTKELKLQSKMDKGKRKGSRSKPLSEQLRTFKAAVAAEEKKAVALTKSIDQTRSQITALQAEMGGANAALESHRQIQKQTRILENRLDKALQKYNETLASNKALRRDIDSLRQERLSFERQYGRMDKELQGIKQQMADVIEAANEAYEIRDNAEFHAAEMRSEMERERAEFTRLLSEVEGRIAEEEARVRRMDEATKGALTASEEAQLQAELTAGERKVELTRAKVARAADKIAYYEEAFTKIRTATGISDIKQLVATFMRNEEENFSLFNFIAEQNAEIEGLEERLAALESDAVRAAKTRGAVVSADRGRLKPLLEEKQALEAATAALEGRFVRAKELVGSVCAAVQRCFAVVGCDEAAMRELVADGTVTAGNAMQFLGVIEQRVTEALQQYVGVKLAAAREGGRGGGGPPAAALPAGPRPASATVPRAPGRGGSGKPRPASATPAAASGMGSLLGTGAGPRWRHGALSSVRVQAPELNFFGGDSDEEGSGGPGMPPFGGATAAFSESRDAKPLSVAELKRMTRGDVKRFQRSVGASLISTPAADQ